MENLSNLDSRDPIWERYRRVWKIYFENTKGRFVKRIGRVYNHVGDDFTDEQMLAKPEDVSNHQHTAGVLYATMVECFPELFDSERTFEMLRLLLIHDVGEGIVGSDAAANGTKKYEEAKAREAIAVGAYIELYPKKLRPKLQENFREFECPAESEDEMVVMAKMTDKLDAVLGLLADERRGVEGSVSVMSIDVTDRDLDRAEFLGTSGVPDGWMLDLRKQLAVAKMREELKNLILGVAWVAFIETRSLNKHYRMERERKHNPDIRSDVPYCLTADINAVE